MKNSLENIDKKAFNWLVDLAHKLIEKGYPDAWFSWLEWVGVSALLFAIAKRINSNTLMFLGVISVAMLFFVGLAGVEKFRDDLLPNLKLSGLTKMIIALAISIFGMWVVMNVLFELLPASMA